MQPGGLSEHSSGVGGAPCGAGGEASISLVLAYLPGGEGALGGGQYRGGAFRGGMSSGARAPVGGSLDRSLSVAAAVFPEGYLVRCISLTPWGGRWLVGVTRCGSCVVGSELRKLVFAGVSLSDGSAFGACALVW